MQFLVDLTRLLFELVYVLLIVVDCVRRNFFFNVSGQR
jgi:hypothetical protein